jgi:diguanylate cyclase (GGDEF)-like protein
VCTILISWFKKQTFTFKILSIYIIGLIFIGFIGYGYFAYSQISYFNKEVRQMRKDVYSQYKDMIKTAVGVAENTINIAQFLSTKGIISEEKAKQIAIYELNSIKYGKSGYVWCMTSDGILIVDPPRGDLVDTNVLNVKDKNGFAIFKYVQDVLKMKDSTFIRYYWEYPGIKDKEFEKLTYVKKINTWGWIIGSGVYIKDIESQVNEHKNSKLDELKKNVIISIIPSIASSLIVLLLFYVILNKIMYSIEKVSEISERLALGDIDKNMKLPQMTGDGSISKLIKNTNKYIENTHNFIQFREKTEICSSEEDILEHIKEFLASEMKIDSFTIYSNINGIFKEYYQKGNIKCLSIEKCISLSSKNLSNTCLDGKRKFICIPIVSDNETVAIIQIVFTENSDKLTKINIIKNYLQSTANSIKIRRLNNKLKGLSLNDQLTGLYNRRFLDEFFKTYESTIKRHNINTAVAMIDIDNFKNINDTYGHQTGDEILKNISTVIKTTFKRSSDLLIRYGGEEFLVILPDIANKDAEEILTECRFSISLIDNNINSRAINVTVSIGWCMIPKDTKELKEAISFADLALYKAKNIGKNRVIKFDKSILNTSFKIS